MNLKSITWSLAASLLVLGLLISSCMSTDLFVDRAQKKAYNKRVKTAKKFLKKGDTDSNLYQLYLVSMNPEEGERRNRLVGAGDNPESLLLEALMDGRITEEELKKSSSSFFLFTSPSHIGRETQILTLEELKNPLFNTISEFDFDSFNEDLANYRILSLAKNLAGRDDIRDEHLSCLSFIGQDDEPLLLGCGDNSKDILINALLIESSETLSLIEQDQEQEQHFIFFRPKSSGLSPIIKTKSELLTEVLGSDKEKRGEILLKYKLDAKIKEIEENDITANEKENTLVYVPVNKEGNFMQAKLVGNGISPPTIILEAIASTGFDIDAFGADETESYFVLFRPAEMGLPYHLFTETEIMEKVAQIRSEMDFRTSTHYVIDSLETQLTLLSDSSDSTRTELDETQELLVKLRKKILFLSK
ncbi:hypothetical protein N8482_00565 [Chitinophagales bacterium]|nr:hypothetical protein [Chitinophagales bacterium]